MEVVEGKAASKGVSHLRAPVMRANSRPRGFWKRRVMKAQNSKLEVSGAIYKK